MNKRWLWILIGVVAFFAVLFSGAVAGAGLTYFALQANPVRAAREVFTQAVSQVEGDYEAGVLVQHVEQGSPAAVSGIKRGDIILAVDDQQVNTMLELMTTLEGKSAGDEVIFTVQHCETTEDIAIELEERNGHIYLGLQLSRSRIFDLRPFFRGEGLLPFEQPAFVITRVIPGSPTDEAGLKAGDIIIAVNDGAFQAEDELADIVQSNQPGEEITLSIYEPGSDEPRQVTVTLGENPEDEDQAYLGIVFRSIPGISGLEGESGQFFQFDIPKFEGEQIPFPQLPEDIMPFMHQFPLLPEGVKQAVVINSVTLESPADEAGLESGDVITAINGEEISDIESFVKSVRDSEPGDEITLTVYRNREEEPFEVDVVLSEDPEQEGQAYLGVGIGGFLHFEHNDPPQDSENPFHFEFHFPWQDGNNHETIPGEEA